MGGHRRRIGLAYKIFKGKENGTSLLAESRRIMAPKLHGDIRSRQTNRLSFDTNLPILQVLPPMLGQPLRLFLCVHEKNTRNKIKYANRSRASFVS